MLFFCTSLRGYNTSVTRLYTVPLEIPLQILHSTKKIIALHLHIIFKINIKLMYTSCFMSLIRSQCYLIWLAIFANLLIIQVHFFRKKHNKSQSWTTQNPFLKSIQIMPFISKGYVLFLHFLRQVKRVYPDFVCLFVLMPSSKLES